MSQSEKVRWECDRCHKEEHTKSSHTAPGGWTTFFRAVKGDICEECSEVLRSHILIPREGHVVVGDDE